MKSNNKLKSESIKEIALKTKRFTEILLKANALNQEELECWIFCNGMLFNSPDKWWGDYGLRDFPHEGIDLCLLKDRDNRIRHLDDKTRIPVMHAGVIRAEFKDYLGRALIIEHDAPGDAIGKFISMYAHTCPEPGMEIGTTVKEGDIIATIADTSHSKANILPHLHFSIGIPLRSFSYEGFYWNMVRDPKLMTLLDPLPVLDFPHQALDIDDPACRPQT